jgi:hypothetical protein
MKQDEFDNTLRLLGYVKSGNLEWWEKDGYSIKLSPWWTEGKTGRVRIFAPTVSPSHRARDSLGEALDFIERNKGREV